MDEIACCLAVTLLPGVGPVLAHRLRERLGSWEAVFSGGPAALRAAGLTDHQRSLLSRPDWEKAGSIRAWADRQGCRLLVFGEPGYPPLLEKIHSAPPLLYVRGEASLLSDPQIAIVGARNATPAGRETAGRFAEALARAGLVVTSGLALGIDGAAHRGALQAGRTIAVTGTGPDSVYPRLHRELHGKILAGGGAVVTECPPGTPPAAASFPLRNRIISGLACGVLVVEAARSSGSLITARHAIEQNREVFAIPGSIHHPLARGCHDLIRRGAKLTETVQDILEEVIVLARMTLPEAGKRMREQPLPAALDERAWQVLAQTGFDVTARDVISARAGLTAAEVSSILLTLELLELVKAVPGGYVRVHTPGD